jgi:ornithine cyclodeaminase/alanine dehydrogenase-like protein (mu-crystallin family)
MKLRVLNAADVRQALPMSEAIEVMRSAYGQLSANEADMPLRTRLETDQGLVLLMPAFLRQSRELGFKMVSIWGDNPAKGLPAVIAIAAVLDPDTGLPLALLNGEALTAIRTGAGGGLATDLLARPDASVVAVFGSGVQARAQLEAACVVRQVKEVRIFGIDPAAVDAFAAEVRSWPNAPQQVLVAGTRKETVNGADIIITATTSDKPVFDGRDLSPGAHITAIGAFTPQMQEVDEVAVQRVDKIVVDSLQACLAEAGDLIIPIEKHLLSKVDIYGEIGEIVNGQKIGRETDEEITMFESVGVAVQDAAAAGRILRSAEAQGLGTVVDL